MVRKTETAQSNEGKVIPLDSRSRAKSENGFEQGKSLPLPLKSLSFDNYEWEVGYFPPSLKSYYRTVLTSIKEMRGLGNQSLRDQIMQAEDDALSSEHERHYGTKPNSRLRDTRLSLDDLKKWLSNTAIHQIGDQKFTFINRYIQSLLAQGILEDFETRYCQERKQFHQQALRDIFSIGYQEERLIKMLDDYDGHCLISAGPLDGRVSHPTALLLLDGFGSGISPATILFSELQLGEFNRKSEVPEASLEKLANDRFSIILRGYLVITAKHPSGEFPLKPYLEGRLILANEDIHDFPMNDLRPARFLAYSLLQVTKNDDGDITRYGVTVDATHFPHEVIPQSWINTDERSQDKGEEASARLFFKFLPRREISERLSNKFGGIYET